MTLHRQGVKQLADGSVEYDVAEIVGPYTWSLLHHAVETFPCEHCREEGTRLLHGLHDVVNADLGKPIKYPQDLKFLAEHVDKAMALVKKAPAGKLSAVNEAEIERLARSAGFLSRKLKAPGDPPVVRWAGKCTQDDPRKPPICDFKVTRKGKSAGELDIGAAMEETINLLKEETAGAGVAGKAGPAEPLTVELSGKSFTLAPETLQAMVKANVDTARTGKEHGFSFCETADGVLVPGAPCVGNSCSIRISPCGAGVKTVGYHHTHPGTLDQQLVQSVGDLTNRIKGQLSCMGGPKRDKVICAALKEDHPTGISKKRPGNAAVSGWSYLHPEQHESVKASMRKNMPKTRLAFGLGKQFNFIEFPIAGAKILRRTKGELSAQGKLPPNGHHDGELAQVLELEDLDQQIIALRDSIKTDPAGVLVKFVKRSGNFKGELVDFTRKQYKQLAGRDPLPAIVRNGRITWELAIDEIAQELGFPSDEALKIAAEKVVKNQRRLEQLELERSRLVQGHPACDRVVNALVPCDEFPDRDCRQKTMPCSSVEMVAVRHPSSWTIHKLGPQDLAPDADNQVATERLAGEANRAMKLIGQFPDDPDVAALSREFPRCGTAKAEQWERCVLEVKAEGGADSPFAVCTTAVGCSPS